MRKIFCAVLALLIVFSLAACKKTAAPETSQPTLVGKWTAQVDMADTVNSMIYAQTGAATVSVSFPVTLELAILADGTYQLQPNQQLLDAEIEALGTVLWQMVVDQAAAQSHMSAADTVEALRNQGKSREVLIQQLDLASVFVNAFTETGVWAADEAGIYFAMDPDGLADAQVYTFTLTDGQLALTFTEEEQTKTFTFTKA